MKTYQSGTIRRKSKPKPFIITLIILAILGGVILMIIPFMIEKESQSRSEPMIDGRFRFIRILDTGDKLEIKYSMSGEETEVYLTKGAESSIEINDEDVLRYIPNASSGKISYIGEEKMDIYTVHFSGRNFSVDYTYKITNIYENLDIIVVGLILIIAGIIGTWNVLHYTNPRYIGKSWKYYSLFLLILGILLIFVEFMSFKFRTLLPFPIILIALSFVGFYYNKNMSSSYIININSSPITTANRIYAYLNKKKIEFETDRNVKDRPYDWQTVFHLKDLGAQIKMVKSNFRNRQTMILLGKQTEQNRAKLIRLANNIANSLKCENFKLILE